MRGDRFLLCSDGLTNELDADQITEVLSSVADPRQAADLLVQAARTHGGSDNITVVVVDVVVGEDGDDSVPGRGRGGRRLHRARRRRHRRRRPAGRCALPGGAARGAGPRPTRAPPGQAPRSAAWPGAAG